MPTLTNTLAVTPRKQIVLNRWRARQYFWQAWEIMPLKLEIRNDKEGNRLAPEDRYEVCLGETIKHIAKVGRAIFNRNHGKHYLSISTESNTRVSYANIPEHKFDSERRMKTRLGRYITRNFEEELEHINERALDMLVEKFLALAADNVDAFFFTVTGQDIVDKYSERWGDTSCMTGDDAGYTQLYADTPECNMLCFDDGKYKGRALLWETEQGLFLDRIYPNSGSHVEKYEIYCNKNNINMRDHNYCPNTSPVSADELTWPEVETRNKQSVSIKIKMPEEYVPYMDTVHWGEWINKVTREAVVYSNPNEHGGTPDFAFNSTEGELTEWEYKDCFECNETKFSGHTYSIASIWGGHNTHIVCTRCARDKYSDCHYCSGMVASKELLYTLTITTQGINICPACASKYAHCCSECGSCIAYNLQIPHLPTKNFCKDCYPKQLAEYTANYTLHKELAIKESIRNEFI